MNEKIRAACISVASNSALTFGKLGVGILMNSVSVISEAMHSGIDLVASLIDLFSVRESSKPADDVHLYGHGKFENVAGIIEAILILVAAVMIVYNAYPKIFSETQTEIHALGLGAVVMVVSAVVNFLVSGKLMRVAKKTESPALAADAWHLRTDVYTSLGVLAGIIGIKITGLMILDPLIAVAVALLIVKAAVELIRDSMRSILDVSLPHAEEVDIREIIKKYSPNFVEFHKLRTRKAGSQRYVDLHLVVPREWVINEVHSLCDRIEEDICFRFSGAHILIHTEPCGAQCGDCSKAGEESRRGTECELICEECVKSGNQPEKK